MAAFWYFLPNATEHDLVVGFKTRWPASLASILADVIDRDRVIFQALRAPALGSSGLAIYPVPPHGRQPHNPGFDADAQQWRKIPNSDLQIGWLRDEPPRPEDLARVKQIDGRLVPDAAGNSWLIPVARARWNDTGTLPTAYGFDADDRPTVGVSSRYRDFWTNACKLWDLIGAVTVVHGEDLQQRFTAEHDAFCWQMIRDALQINYRVDCHVLATLEAIYPGWLSAEAARLMLNSICDCEAYRLYFDSQKKTESRSDHGGSPSGPGDPDGMPTSIPA